MTVAAATGLLACGIFGAALLHATVTDLRHRRIRNWMVAGLAACWPPMALAVGIPAAEMAAAAAAAALVFAAGFGCFAAGWLGGGDVKLATVAVLWLGAGQALAFVLLTAVLGGLLTGIVLLARLIAGPAARPTRGTTPRGSAATGPGAGQRAAPEAAETPGPAGTRATTSTPVPYGPALAIAGFALLHGSPWVAAL